MKKKLSDDASIILCKKLGLDPSRLKSIDIQLRAGQVITVVATFLDGTDVEDWIRDNLPDRNDINMEIN